MARARLGSDGGPVSSKALRQPDRIAAADLAPEPMGRTDRLTELERLDRLQNGLGVSRHLHLAPHTANDPFAVDEEG